MRKLFTLLLTFLLFQCCYAQTKNWPQAVEDKIKNPLNVDSLESLLIDSLEFVFIVQIVVEDEDATTGTKLTVPAPWNMKVTRVKAFATVAPTGANMLIDITEDASTILSTVISIDAGEFDSDDSATPPVIVDNIIVERAKIGFDIDQVGSTVAGQGVKVEIYHIKQ